ncbi:MAG: hypothetical protein G01um101433_954 [Parcubacteria group bacterium Gr01-1014_33]|nr:MAG: hypothetical protein G01um101433_954 [Parcubacteria group bacterium Gr01-1014_33]
MENRHCQNCKTEFLIEPEDFAFYEKMKVPPPTFCPDCRMIRRMMFRNERFLFRRKDDASGKEIFSEFPPSVPAKIYEKDYWWSDAWDPMEYGKEYNFSRSFFEQFRELLYTVPWPSRNVLRSMDSDYSNNATDIKNCYLCFNVGKAEDSAYLVDVYNQKNCFDITSTTNAELCYDGIAVRDCYKTFYSVTCEKCHEVWLSRDCTGCSYCFGCANLRNKQYYIFNKPYTKEGYFFELEKILQGGSYHAFEVARAKAKEVWRSQPHKYMVTWHNTNATGDWVVLSKNAGYCFNVVEVEDAKYCQNAVQGVRDAYDFSVGGDKCELVYEAEDVWEGCRNVKFSFDCWPANQDIEYSAKCSSSANLFGCVGLKKKSYCIFNKQYSRDDYMALREKIIAQMNAMPYNDRHGRIYRYGEFFPTEFSPFAYNESIAQDFFQLIREEAEQKGYFWRDPELREYQTTIDARDLPDRIGEASDSILQEIIKCVSCGKAYRIIQMELDFLRQMSLPLPRQCVNCRYLARFNQRNQPRFYHGRCQCAGEKSSNSMYQNAVSHFHGAQFCPNEFETSYAPNRPEIIYCEQCYNAEVV